MTITKKASVHLNTSDCYKEMSWQPKQLMFLAVHFYIYAKRMQNQESEIRLHKAQQKNIHGVELYTFVRTFFSVFALHF